MKQARFRVSAPMLERLLLLPENARVVGVSGTAGSGDLTVLVQSPDLKGEDGEVGECLPTYTNDAEGRPMFIGWGQE